MHQGQQQNCRKNYLKLKLWESFENDHNRQVINLEWITIWREATAESTSEMKLNHVCEQDDTPPEQ